MADLRYKTFNIGMDFPADNRALHAAKGNEQMWSSTSKNRQEEESPNKFKELREKTFRKQRELVSIPAYVLFKR